MFRAGLIIGLESVDAMSQNDAEFIPVGSEDDRGKTVLNGGDAEPSIAAVFNSPEEASLDAVLEGDRRQAQKPVLQERRQSSERREHEVDRRVINMGSPTGLERRRGPGRRRTDDRRSAEEGEMTDEQFEFVLAVDTYKRLNNRPFPSWTEILEIVKQLGYRKVEASTIQLPATSRAVKND